MPSIGNLSLKLDMLCISRTARFSFDARRAERRDKKRRMFSVVFDSKKIAQMQVNCLSSDVMRKAQQEPENYRDLIVRVVGYSANFVTLPPTVQDLVLEREEHPLNS